MPCIVDCNCAYRGLSTCFVSSMPFWTFVRGLLVQLERLTCSIEALAHCSHNHLVRCNAPAFRARGRYYHAFRVCEHEPETYAVE